MGAGAVRKPAQLDKEGMVRLLAGSTRRGFGSASRRGEPEGGRGGGVAKAAAAAMEAGEDVTSHARANVRLRFCSREFVPSSQESLRRLESSTFECQRTCKKEIHSPSSVLSVRATWG